MKLFLLSFRFDIYLGKHHYRMSTRYVILIILNLAFVSPVSSQREANICYFGDRTGMDFTNGDPVPLDDGELKTRGISAVADHPITSELLFYTDAMNVWGREYQIMPNCSGCSRGGGTQCALIVPVPGTDQKFYLFTLYRNALLYLNLNYHVIDMTLKDALRDVVETRKNQLLLTNLTGKTTAVPHTDGQGVWLITGADVFYTSLITADGLCPFNAQTTNPLHYPLASVESTRFHLKLY